MTLGESRPTITWDFSDFEVSYEVLTFDEPINAVSLNLVDHDVMIEPSVNDEFSVTFHGTYASRMDYSIANGELTITHPLSDWELVFGNLLNSGQGWQITLSVPNEMIDTMELLITDADVSIDGQRVQNLVSLSLTNSTLTIKDSTIASLQINAHDVDAQLTEVDVPLSHTLTGDRIIYAADSCYFREVDYSSSTTNLILNTVTAYRFSAQLSEISVLVAEQLVVSHFLDIEVVEGEVAIQLAQPLSSFAQVWLESNIGYVYFGETMAEHTFSASYNGTLNCNIASYHTIIVEFDLS